MPSTATQYNPTVRVDGKGHVKPARANSSQANTYEYMREFAKWLIDESSASADLKARANKFYTDLKTATKTQGDTCLLVPGQLPSRASYLELVTAYNAEIDSNNATDTSTASEPPAGVADTSDQQVATPARTARPAHVVEAQAPASTPAVEPAVASTPAPASQPAPVVNPAPHSAPVAEPVVESSKEEQRHQELMNALNGFGAKVDKHDKDLYGENGDAGLVKDVRDHGTRLKYIEAAMPRHDNGTLIHYSEWETQRVAHEPAPSRTSRVTSTVSRVVTGKSGKLNWKWALAAFVVMLVLLAFFMDPTGPDTGTTFSITPAKILWAGLVSLIVFVLSNLHLINKPAPAA